MKLLSIDLHRTKNHDISNFFSKIGLSKDSINQILDDKKSGFATFWIEVDERVNLVAYSRKSNLKKVHFATIDLEIKYSNRLDEFTKYVKDVKDNVSKKVKSVETLNLTVDDVLDKINESGLESLTQKELDVLKSH